MCVCVCRSRGIGVWYGVMQSMVFLAILTNCAILGFSSEQLIQWLPYLFTKDGVEDSHVMAMGSGRWVWSNVVGVTLAEVDLHIICLECF